MVTLQTITSTQTNPTDTIFSNVPLHDKNWFRTGGVAKFYSEPTTPSALQQAIVWARDNKEPLYLLGEGANILISDDGFSGLIIRPRLEEITFQPHPTSDQHMLVTAQAGVSLHNLIATCLANNCLGPEELSGIPGTVGGSVFINIHYYEFLLSNFLTHATVIDKETGEPLSVDNSWFQFGYDTSKLHEQKHVLLSATFTVTKASDLETAYAQGRSAEIIRQRNKRFPTSRTCGSFFRNFHDYEVSLVSTGIKMIYVAYYLDKIGVKGSLNYGDAIVSHQHANMIVNRGKATSSDITNLACMMQKLVIKEFGITPQPECQLIGFDQYPLIRSAPTETTHSSNS